MIRCIISILFPSFLELRGCNKIWLSFNNILIWLSLWWYSRVKCGIHNGSLCISRWNVICVWYLEYGVNGTSFIYLIVFFFLPYNSFLMDTIVHVKRVGTSPSFKGLRGSWIWSRFEWFRCRGGGVILSIVKKKKKILMGIKFRLKQALTSLFFFIIYSAFGPHYFANAKWSLGPNFLYCTGWASWSTFHTLCWPQGLGL